MELKAPKPLFVDSSLKVTSNFARLVELSSFDAVRRLLIVVWRCDTLTLK